MMHFSENDGNRKKIYLKMFAYLCALSDFVFYPFIFKKEVSIGIKIPHSIKYSYILFFDILFFGILFSLLFILSALITVEETKNMKRQITFYVENIFTENVSFFLFKNTFQYLSLLFYVAIKFPFTDSLFADRDSCWNDLTAKWVIALKLKWEKGL